MIIYKATSKINDKCYIGQTTTSIIRRRNSHVSETNKGSSLVFHRAIRKYGIENFFWEVLCECETKDELNEMEFHYIKQYHSHVSEYGYNFTWGGDGGNGLYGDDNPSKRPEVRKKMSIAASGRVLSEKTREKISNFHKGKKTSDETKQKISDAHKGKKNPMYGKTHTDKVKKIISDAHKGKYIGSKSVRAKRYVCYKNGILECLLFGEMELFCKKYSITKKSFFKSVNQEKELKQGKGKGLLIKEIDENEYNKIKELLESKLS